MRIKATIIVSFKMMVSQWKQMLLMYSIFPLILSFLMGYFQRESFKPDMNMDKIKVTITDKDKSESSKSFMDFFNSEEMKRLFEVKDNGDYFITIPEGYEKSLSDMKETSIKIEEKERVSSGNEAIVRGVIDQYGKIITQGAVISNKIQALGTEDKDKLYKEIANKLSELTQKSSIKESILQGEATLTSYENQGASMITYFLILIIFSCVSGYHMDKENGSFKKLMSTPISRLNFFNLDLLIFFIYSFVYSLLYILTFRVAGIAFKGVNPILIFSLLVCQSLVVTAFAGLIIAFVSKKYSNIIMMLVMYFQIIFGGIFLPVKDVNSEIFTLAAKFAPGNLLAQAYRSCMLFNSFSRIEGYLGSMLLISIIAYLISMVKVKVRWEE